MKKLKIKMSNKYFFLIVIMGFFTSCSAPSEFNIPDSSKPADNFSRTFIEKVINGNLESAYLDIEPKLLNQEAKEFIINANRNISNGKLNKISVVEYNWKTMFSTSSEKFSEYKLSYEYEFANKNILFRTILQEKNNKFVVVMFNGEILPGKLSELTKFNFESKSIVHYIFLSFAIVTPIFIFITLFYMLRSRITTKQKIIWSIAILIVCFPKFVIDWNNGTTDFNFLNFSLFGSGFTKPNLYSAWLISFHIPIGALVYWFKKKSYLISEIEEEE